MFYKIIPFLVDLIAKKWRFCLKISKIWQFTEAILPDTNAVKSNNLKNKQLFFLILYGEISVLIGPIPRLFVTDA